MEKYLCTNTFVPLRMGPSHKSEQGSQILFGEEYTIIDRAGSWLKIQLEFDKYSGWIDTDHHMFLEKGSGNDSPGILNRTTVFSDPDNNLITLEPGSELYNIDNTGKSFKLGDKVFDTETKILTGTPEESITDTARRFLNSPYLWGGRVSSGMDCSGLTQIVFKIHGFRLPRDSFIQAQAGSTVNFIEEARNGDLLFFDDARGNISHVGIFMNGNKIIHASGKVRIDRIDHQGIFNEELNRYTHKLRMIRRIEVRGER